MNDTIYNIANHIITQLLDKGFIIQRYDSKKSSSVYLKLDYGACNSIRISDHTGKKYLHYKYNVILDCQQHIESTQYLRYYYNQNTVNDMIALILQDRHTKITKYGMTNYTQFMQKNEQNHKIDKTGFWKKATLITKQKSEVL